jgi:hypothetical protein
MKTLDTLYIIFLLIVAMIPYHIAGVFIGPLSHEDRRTAMYIEELFGVRNHGGTALQFQTSFAIRTIREVSKYEDPAEHIFQNAPTDYIAHTIYNWIVTVGNSYSFRLQAHILVLVLRTVSFGTAYALLWFFLKPNLKGVKHERID